MDGITIVFAVFDLSDSILTGAIVNNEQLAQSSSLVGATMPNGSTIETEEQEKALPQGFLLMIPLKVFLMEIGI